MYIIFFKIDLKFMIYQFVLFSLIAYISSLAGAECCLSDSTLSTEFSKEQKFEDKWKRVYLATYPRSGNHWMRYLFEEATGVATSSVYRDPDPKHDEEVYPWGAYSIDGGYTHAARLPTEDDIIIIKTHFPALKKSESDLKPHLRTLRIIRHPLDSIYSHYCYDHKPTNILPWGWILECCENWARFQEYWNHQPDVISIRYEDLMNYPFEQLMNCFTTIGLPTENLAYAILQHPPEGKSLKHINHYTNKQLKYIEIRLSTLLKKFGYTMSSVKEKWDCGDQCVID